MVIVVFGVVLGGAGATLAVRPFDTRIQLSETTQPPLGSIVAGCRSPVFAAWNTDRKGQLALWAVTRGTGESGYEVRSGQDPYCARPARVRLVVALAGVFGGLGLAVVGLTRARSS